MKTTTFIYILVDPSTDMVRYVGKTNNKEERYKAHKNPARRESNHRKNWVASLRKRGLKPIMEIIDEVPIEEWRFWEIYWISQLRTWGFDLMNYTNGGDGATFANSTSFKMGQGAKPVYQIDKVTGKILKEYPSAVDAAAIYGNNVGSVTSGHGKTAYGYIWLKKEVYDKMSEKDMQQFVYDINHPVFAPNSGQFKKGEPSKMKGVTGAILGGKRLAVPVLQFDLNGNFIKKFRSYGDAAKELNCHAESIRACCVGKRKKAYNFIWKYDKTNSSNQTNA